MTDRTMTLSLSVPESAVSAVRMVLATVVGGLVGAAIAPHIAVFNAVPILIGLTLGLFVGSPWRSGKLEDLVSRGALALGSAFLAGELFDRAENVAAWALAIFGMAVAIGLTGNRMRERVASFCIAGASAAVGFASIFALEEAGVLFWTLDGFGSSALVSALVGGVAWAGTRVSNRMVETAKEAQKRAEINLHEVETTDFEHEYDELTDAADRVQQLLSNLERSHPEEAGMVDRIRESVDGTMKQAERALVRWRLASQTKRDDRVERIRSRIADNEARLEAEKDASVRRELKLTLERQQSTLEAHERIESGRRSFGFRLQQVQAGLEMLELAIEQTMTGSRDLDSVDVDAMIEAMQEANSALDVGLGAEIEAELADAQSTATEPTSSEPGSEVADAPQAEDSDDEDAMSAYVESFRG